MPRPLGSWAQGAEWFGSTTRAKTLQAISPYEVEFRLLRPGHPAGVAFANHVTDLLNYRAGEVRVIAPTAPAAVPPALAAFAAWTVVPFNH